MSVTLHTLSGNVDDLASNAVDPRHTIMWVETNSETNMIVDTGSGGGLLVGATRIDIADDGSFAIDLPTTSGATIPTNFQYRVWVEFRTIFDGAVKKERATTGWFSLTASVDVKDIVEETLAPAAYQTQLLAYAPDSNILVTGPVYDLDPVPATVTTTV